MLNGGPFHGAPTTSLGNTTHPVFWQPQLCLRLSSTLLAEGVCPRQRRTDVFFGWSFPSRAEQEGRRSEWHQRSSFLSRRGLPAADWLYDGGCAHFPEESQCWQELDLLDLLRWTVRLQACCYSELRGLYARMRNIFLAPVVFFNTKSNIWGFVIRIILCCLMK